MQSPKHHLSWFNNLCLKFLRNNYDIIIAKGNQQIAEINNNWGTAGRYPTIGFDASDNNSYELNSSSYTNRLSAGVGLNWILFDGFRVNITKTKLENLEDLTGRHSPLDQSRHLLQGHVG